MVIVTLAPEYEDLIRRLTVHFKLHNVSAPIHLLKVQEEVGEVAEAYIGFLGLNPRKGITHSLNDVAMELADVVTTALVGIQMLGFTPDYILAQQAEKTEERLRDAS